MILMVKIDHARRTCKSDTLYLCPVTFGTFFVGDFLCMAFGTVGFSRKDIVTGQGAGICPEMTVSTHSPVVI
jgi:hypothetical protein